MKTFFLALLVSMLALNAFAEPGGSGTVGIGNPASENCLKLKGKILVLSDVRGQFGMCQIGKGLIEEWTLFREKPVAHSKAVHALLNPIPKPPFHGNPASDYCIAIGGEVQVGTDVKGNQYGLCGFDDRSIIDEWTLFRGPKDPGNKALIKVLTK